MAFPSVNYGGERRRDDGHGYTRLGGLLMVDGQTRVLRTQRLYSFSGSQMQNDWVEVRSCAWLHEAAFFKSVLDAAGIEAVIPNEQTLGVQPLYGLLLGGVTVLVREGDDVHVCSNA